MIVSKLKETGLLDRLESITPVYDGISERINRLSYLCGLVFTYFSLQIYSDTFLTRS